MIARDRSRTAAARAAHARKLQLAHGFMLFSCAAAALVWSRLALARLWTVHHHTFDLAEYARLAWGLAHGEPWDAIMGGHVLGGHMPWVLAPLGLLARALPVSTAELLLVAQALCMAFSAYFVFRIALRALGTTPALLVGLAYLAYPNLGHVATYEMHPGSLALLPLAWAFDLLDAQRDRGPPPAQLFACACAAMLACRASLALEVIALCVLAALQTRAVVPHFRTIALVTAALSFAYLAASMLLLRPTFAGGTASFDAHFGPWGGSPFGIAHALLTRPSDVLAHLAAPERLRYLPMLLAPFAFVPLLGPRALLVALPSVAINLASVFPTTTRIDSHYLTPAVPALAVAAIEGLCVLARRARAGGSQLAPLAFAVFTVALLAQAVAGGAPWSLDFAPRDFVSDPRTHAARAMLARIPQGASVQAPDPLLPHLAERARVHRAPPPDRDTAFVVLDLDHRRRYARSEDLLRTQEEPLARSWLARDALGLVAYETPYALLARGQSPRGGYARRYFIARERAAPTATDQRLTDCVALRSAVLREDHVLDLILRASGPCAEDLALRLGHGARPTRVDLPCEGLLSPAHWRAGDLLRSPHALSVRENKAVHTAGLWIAALRSSGARPNPEDPSAVPVTIAYGR